MKKAIISFFLAFLSLSSVTLQAACNTGAIVYKHQTGFGISLGGGESKNNYSDSSSINVPLTINGELACYRKKTKFSLKAENSKDSDTGKILITPMKTEFENIPDPSSKQYLIVESNPDKLETKFHLLSFVCSGELPLSIEANSDRYSKILLDSNKASVEVHMVFATGKAAENLNRGRVSDNQETFDYFGKIYKEKTHKELESLPCCGQKVPSILSSTSINSLSGIERAVASSFTTMGARVPNGCSKEFSDSMKDYLLENYEKNDSLKKYKVKKKWFSDDLSFEWQ